MLEDVLKTIAGRREQSLERLKSFLSIPSVSTQPKHAADVRHAADWLADQLRFAELDVRVMPTGPGGSGHPVVVAKNRHVRGRPTVLYYGHYDVQPPEPLDLWDSPPFEPTVRDGKLFARGASDDKGQVWCHVEAVTCWQAHGGVPCNLTMLIEGEEESGSENLEQFLEEQKAHLAADVCLVSDSAMFAPGVPAIDYGLRGLCYMEVFFEGPNHDLHSGIFGGAVPNPANVLCRVLGQLHDENGRVTLPGFYDRVEEITQTERQMWKQLPFDEAAHMKAVGLSHGSGEAGYSALERTWCRPTCDINGIVSGYIEPGAKTVLPSRASAKVSFRLVPYQDPHAVQQAFEQFVRERTPDNVKVSFKNHGLAPAVVVPIESKASELAAQAVEKAAGRRPVFIRGGGSIPIVASISQTLGIDTLLVGFGLPDDRLHSPNEKFDLTCLEQGTRTAAALYERLSLLPTKSLPVAG
ncbi:MAG: dipeptidase [Phycisphaerae bacterium]